MIIYCTQVPLFLNFLLRKGLKRHPFFEMAIAPAKKKDIAESPTQALAKALARVTLKKKSPKINWVTI